MKVYTFSEARQHFASILELAQQEGCVQVARRDGGVFNIQPAPKPYSPLDVEGISLNLSREEIVSAVRESRRPDRAALDAALAQVPNVEPEAYDRLEKPDSAPMIKR